MEAYASLGPKVPPVAADTAPVILQSWSLQHEVDYSGNAIFIATVKPRRGSAITGPSLLFLTVRPERKPRIISSIIIELNGHRQTIATAAVPGLIADLARTKVAEIFT